MNWGMELRRESRRDLSVGGGEGGIGGGILSRRWWEEGYRGRRGLADLVCMERILRADEMLSTDQW